MSTLRILPVTLRLCMPTHAKVELQHLRLFAFICGFDLRTLFNQLKVDASLIHVDISQAYINLVRQPEFHTPVFPDQPM